MKVIDVTSALNLYRIGHLIECEIHPSEGEKGMYNLIAIAENDRYMIGNDSRKNNYVELSYAKGIARRIGFAGNEVKVIKATA